MGDIDLHFHSSISDGVLSPAAVIERAALNGARLLALTDHDCTLGLDAARTCAQALGVGWIDGVEISVSWGQSQHTVHIVGLGFDARDRVLLQGLAQLRQGRLMRARRIADSLAQRGIFDAYNGALAYATQADLVGRMHFARFLIAQGYAKDTRAVFRRYLTPGKPGYVKHQWATLEEAVSWISGAGGMAIIAHPGRYQMGPTLMRKLLLAFKDAGGEGIEVVSGCHSAKDNQHYAVIAQQFGLLSSVGSDFHAPGFGREVGRTLALPASCRPVWERLL